MWKTFRAFLTYSGRCYSSIRIRLAFVFFLSLISLSLWVYPLPLPHLPSPLLLLGNNSYLDLLACVRMSSDLSVHGDGLRLFAPPTSISRLVSSFLLLPASNCLFILFELNLRGGGLTLIKSQFWLASLRKIRWYKIDQLDLVFYWLMVDRFISDEVIVRRWLALVFYKHFHQGRKAFQFGLD